MVSGVTLNRLRLGIGILFASQFAALDIAIRGPGAYLSEPRLAGGLLASWALLVLILKSRHLRHAGPRAIVSLAFGGLLVAALAYFRYYHAPFDAQAALAARHAWADVRPMLRQGTPVLLPSVLLVAALEYAALIWAEPPKVARVLVIILALGGYVVTGSPRDGTSEIRSAHATWVLLRTHEVRTVGGRPALPDLESTRNELPNVLLVITESVRASDACQSRGCTTGPELDRLLPDRVTMAQSRSLASYTAIALSALATGQTQLKSRSDLAKAPDLFDLAHAVRARGARYSIRYWSSQLAGVFERGELNAIAKQVITAETLLGHPLSDIEDAVAAVLDRRVADHCERNLRQVSEPQFLVVHLSGTHAPYAFDAERASFQPWQRQVTWSGLNELHHAYLNALIEQDRSLGRCLDVYMKAVAGHPWIVIYTSDHGESFGEHSAIHHGQNLYDEQIHVPLIIAHGGGALSAAQADALRANAGASVTHLDLLPTLLDLWGLRGHIALQTWAAKLPGRSLFETLGPLGILPITNCTELFPCPINTWGLLAEGKKLTAQSWDGNWRCLFLQGEERERDLGQCADLVQAACKFYAHLPNGKPVRACGK